MDLYRFSRRRTHEVRVGVTAIGGGNPIRVQSMTNTVTMDTDACVAQAMCIAQAGGELVRLTTQGVREAENMSNIRRELRAMGCDVPLVADVHFNPLVAEVAAHNCEKVRINPGNYTDAARQFKQIEYTDEEYAAELQKIERRLLPLLDICREHHTALRIGVNHGSLSDRIMSRYGDTPEGIVESCMEFLRILWRERFLDVVISIKASNTVVMVRSVRLLVVAMEREGMTFPLHLGVTEAGEGEDGRIKSAVGIGALLADGIGDTIRVSLSEAPEREIPVARHLVDVFSDVSDSACHDCRAEDLLPWLSPMRRVTMAAGVVGGGQVPVVVGADLQCDDIPMDKVIVFEPQTSHVAQELRSFVAQQGKDIRPIILKLSVDDAVSAAALCGAPLIDGLVDGLWLPELSTDVAFGILQAARLRVTRTEYISCPGCGRTLYDLEGTIRRIREATKHLTGLKIAIMGCIVNGPGEMADADYGYVGAARGKVSLYRRKELVERNVPQEEAVEHLLALIEGDRDKVV